MEMIRKYKNLENWVNSDKGFKFHEDEEQDNLLSPYHTKYEIEMSYNNKVRHFSYQCNTDFTKPNKKDCLYCLLSDMSMYESCRDIDDFWKIGGFDKVSECLNAYESCWQESAKLHELFNDDEIKMFDIIFEDY